MELVVTNENWIYSSERETVKVVPMNSIQRKKIKNKDENEKRMKERDDCKQRVMYVYASDTKVITTGLQDVSSFKL